MKENGSWRDRSSRPKTIHRKVNEELRERIRELRVKQGMNVEKISYLLKQEWRKRIITKHSN